MTRAEQMRDYAVTVTGPSGASEGWEDHLDVLPQACMLGGGETPPRLVFTVAAETPLEACVSGVTAIRDLGILDETALAAEPADA